MAKSGNRQPLTAESISGVTTLKGKVIRVYIGRHFIDVSKCRVYNVTDKRKSRQIDKGEVLAIVSKAKRWLKTPPPGSIRIEGHNRYPSRTYDIDFGKRDSWFMGG